MFRFLNWYLLFLIPIIIYLFFQKRKSESIKFSSIELLKNKGLKKTNKHKIGKYLILISMIFFVIALARPQSGKKQEKINKKGIDIVMSIDVSLSMMQEDFKPNRLESAKKVAIDFVGNRTTDRIGMVVFAGTAYTKIPLTLDYNIIKESVAKITPQDIMNNRSTAIGMGLAVALNRLKKSDAKSKIIILLTDGENNAGEVSPEVAAQLAKEMNVKVYTIGLGAEYIEHKSFFGTQKVKNTELDEKLLDKIASETGGKYYRATDEETLKKIFETIDKLEKTEIKVNNFYSYKELYKNWVKFGLLFLLIGLVFENLIYVKVP